MGGWFVDVIVGYLITGFRIRARGMRARRSKDWRETVATVVGASCQSSRFIPRPVAEIVYTYRIDGGSYGGVDEKPFFSKSDAESYANQFTRGDELVIRVKPGELQASLVRDEDQVRSKPSAVGTRHSD